MNTLYYYADDQNQPVGPFQLGDLRRMREAGLLGDATMVFPEGGTEWTSLGSVLPASRPPAAPPPARRALAARRTPAEEPQPTPAKAERNAATCAATSVILPGVAMFFSLAMVGNPLFYFIMIRSRGIVGPLLFFVFFLVALLGAVGAFKLLRLEGIFQRKPVSVVVAWIGAALFLVSVVVIVFCGLALEAEYAHWGR